MMTNNSTNNSNNSTNNQTGHSQAPLKADAAAFGQSEFQLAEFTIDADEIEMDLSDSNNDSDGDSSEIGDLADLENASDELSFGSTETANLGGAVGVDTSAPHLDTTLQAPIEADTELMNEIHSIPAKMAFKIGEAAEMVGVKQYVLRYWESEFDNLKPRKSSNGQRIYSRRDVETAMMIKKLLYNDRFSIEGARTALKHLKSTVKSTVQEEKTTEKLVKSQETVVSLLQSLLGDIRRARAAF